MWGREVIPNRGHQDFVRTVGAWGGWARLPLQMQAEHTDCCLPNGRVTGSGGGRLTGQSRTELLQANTGHVDWSRGLFTRHNENVTSVPWPLPQICNPHYKESPLQRNSTHSASHLASSSKLKVSKARAVWEAVRQRRLETRRAMFPIGILEQWKG